MITKTSWEIREYVEDALPQCALDCDVDWSEAHFDKWTKEYNELHERDSKKWVSLEDFKKIMKSVRDLYTTAHCKDITQIEEALKSIIDTSKTKR